jgi:hypothetical protein
MIAVALEIAVAMLLVVTIGYCVVLNRKLRMLRDNEKVMRSVVVELVQATDRAEKAIRALKATAKQCDETLGVELQAARQTSERLGAERRHAEQLFERLAQITGVARESGIVEAPTGAQPAGEGEEPVVSALSALRARAA